MKKNLLQFFFSLFFLFSLFSFANDLVIIHTNDNHGYLKKTEKKNTFGLFQLSSIINQIKQQNPDYLWIDTGDCMAGGFEAWATQGQIIYQALHFMGCHFFIPGNHEFDLGPACFVKNLTNYPQNFLCCNLKITNTQNKEQVPIRPYIITQRQGKKIAIIGATRDYISNLQNQYNLDHLLIQTERILPILPQIIKEIKKEQPDFIILAIHQGKNIYKKNAKIELVNLIALNFPEIDLILGGHTHLQDSGRLLQPNTWYTQAPCHAAGLNQIKVKLQKNQRPQITSSLIFTKNYPEDKQLKKYLQLSLRTCEEQAKKIVFNSKTTINSQGQLGINCLYSEINHLAFIHATHADASFQGKFDNCSIAAGPVKMLDLFNFIPYDNKIFLVDLSINDLETIIKENENKSTSSAYSVLHGISWTWNEKKTEVKLLLPDKLKNKPKLTIAINSYFAGGAGYLFKETAKIFSQPENNLRNTHLSSREIVSQWLKNNSQISTVTAWKKIIKQ